MDVLAGVLTSYGNNGQPDHGDFESALHERSTWARRRFGLSTVQLVSSLASFVDWVTDFQYYFHVRSWVSGVGYEPTDGDIVSCILHLQSGGTFVGHAGWVWDDSSTSGGGVGGTAFDAVGTMMELNGTNTTVDRHAPHSAATADGCIVAATDALKSAVETCEQPVLVPLSRWVMALLLCSACAGMAGDLFRAYSTLAQVNSVKIRVKHHYLSQDGGVESAVGNPLATSEVEQSPRLPVLPNTIDRMADDQMQDAPKSEEDDVTDFTCEIQCVKVLCDCLSHGTVDVSPADTGMMNGYENLCQRLHGCCGCLCVLVEDFIQLFLTFYIELGPKSDAIIGGGASFGSQALISVLAGLLNGIFKLLVGWHEWRKGALDDILRAVTLAHETDINVDGGAITTQEVGTLFNMLANKPLRPQQPMQLRTLCLVNMGPQLNDEVAAKLADAVLPQLPNLHTLDLGQHGMTVEGVKAIVARLPPRMRMLGLGAPWFKGARHAPIGAEAGVAIAAGLAPSATTLRCLALGTARIGDRGVAALAETFRAGGNALRQLYLHNNDIGDDGASALMGVFPRLKRLRVLALLGGNRIGTETEATLRAAAAAELLELRSLR